MTARTSFSALVIALCLACAPSDPSSPPDASAKCATCASGTLLDE